MFDCETVWKEWGSEGVKLGYDTSGYLVAIQILEPVDVMHQNP